MKPFFTFWTLVLAAALWTSSCAPAADGSTAAPATDTSAPATATKAPTSAPVEGESTVEPAPVVQPLATSRGPELHATDPTTVQLAAGQLQVLEFFRFT